MNLRLTPYPEYKDSGLPWLGGIPRHWHTGPGFAAFREKQVKNTGMKEKTVLSLSYGRIVVKPPEKLHGLVPVSFDTYQIVNPGDIIIRSTDLQNDWNSLRVGLVRDRGIITSAYLCFGTTGALIPEYGYLQLHAFDLMKVFYGMGSGLRQNLDFSDFKRMLIFIPPPAEQSAIVRFLDHADRRIRRYIGAKRRLIELLNEQKQAIIHQAVTRGLDPNVRLKPSGIDWLGEVPEHWEVGRLDRFITLQRGVDITKEQQVQGDIPVVSSGGISSFHNQFTSRGPGVIVGRKGTVGSVYFLDGDYWAHDTTLWVKEFSGNHPKFVYHLLRKLDLKRFDTGSANPTLNRNVVHPERVAFPPVDEQRAIASFLDQRSQKIDSQIRILSRQIELLWEYRARLVADIVTGKLDVRGVELPQSEEAEELSEVGDETAHDATEEGDEVEAVEDVADAAD
jgi:type I restriction enzyme S subunit